MSKEYDELRKGLWALFSQVGRLVESWPGAGIQVRTNDEMSDSVNPREAVSFNATQC